MFNGIENISFSCYLTIYLPCFFVVEIAPPLAVKVIFLQATNDEITFTQEDVSKTTTHRYRVLRMWEQDSALFLENPALLPLALLTKTNSPEILLS